MQIGLLWYDDNTARSLKQKVARAAARYHQKHGQVPNICYVHPTALLNGSVNVGPVAVNGKQSVLPHHFWIGLQKPTEEEPCSQE